MVNKPTHSVARQLIVAAGGRQTMPRIMTLETLMSAGCAITHTDAHKKLPTLDRVSLYRALDWLADHKLAHRLTGADGVRRFGPSVPEKNHLHPHFHCTHCKQTTCMEGAKKVPLRIPDGYQLTSTEILVQGLCKKCVSRESLTSAKKRRSS